jgi:hypothetical protein
MENMQMPCPLRAAASSAILGKTRSVCTIEETIDTRQGNVKDQLCLLQVTATFSQFVDTIHYSQYQFSLSAKQLQTAHGNRILREITSAMKPTAMSLHAKKHIMRKGNRQKATSVVDVAKADEQ